MLNTGFVDWQKCLLQNYWLIYATDVMQIQRLLLICVEFLINSYSVLSWLKYLNINTILNHMIWHTFMFAVNPYINNWVKIMVSMSGDSYYPFIRYTVGENFDFDFASKIRALELSAQNEWLFISANRCGQWIRSGYLIAYIGPQLILMNEIHVK